MLLYNYLKDGANYNARAVMCLLQGRLDPDIHDKVNIARWENFREQGYVIYVSNGKEQINIAFFEHRNSDEICAVKWIQDITMNSPTIDTAKFGDVYKDQYDTTYEVDSDGAYQMCQWVLNEIDIFLNEK